MNDLSKNFLLLGSASPRRIQILSYFKIPFQQASSNFDEDKIIFKNNPKSYVLKLSYEKAKTLQNNFPENLILTADTIVYKEGSLYGKPKTFEEAFSFLKSLSNSWHSVYTGLTLMNKNQIYQGYEKTKVKFNALKDDEIIKYLNSIQWSDKAGAYAIQESGSILIHKINGCYYNVMGLPINVLRNLLLHANIDLWDYL